MSNMGEQYETSWVPYEGSSNSKRSWHSLRWKIWWPMQWRVPVVNLSIGELIIILGTFALFIIGSILSPPRYTWHSAGPVPWEPTGQHQSGHLATLALALTFATAAHNSIFSFLFGLPFERAMFWHKYFAVWSVVVAAWHGFIHTPGHTKYLRIDQWTSGIMAISLMGVLMLSFHAPFRRLAWEVFYKLHLMVILSLAVAVTLHGGYYAWTGMGLWVFDVGFRYLYLALVKNRRSANLVVLPSHVTKVVIETGGKFQFRAGQYIFLCVPEISLFEWHPFSISSAPAHAKTNEKIELHVRAVGDWTRRLESLAEKKGPSTALKVLFEGPYGEPQIDTEGNKYTLFLLISGGIGVTPLQSICNQLVDERTRGRPLDLCWFIWSCRDKGLGENIAEAMVNQWDNTIPCGGRDEETKNDEEDEAWSCWLPTLPVSPAGGWVSSLFTYQTEEMPEGTIPPPPPNHPRRKCASSKGCPHATSVMAPKPQGPGLSFQPNTLEVLSKSSTVTAKLEQIHDNSNGFVDLDFLHTDLYLTGVQSKEDVEAIKAGQSGELFTFGRPDFKRTFQAMASIAEDKGRTHVAVISCGPVALINAVARECKSFNASSKIKFDCHFESFEL